MKKILVITDNIIGQINGVATTFENLAKQAEKDDYEIVFLTPSDFPHFSAPSYPEVKIAIPLRMSKKIDKIDPDYIHIATEGPLGITGRFYSKSRKYNYSTSYHTKFPEFLHKMHRIPTSWTYAFLRWFHKDSYKVLTTTKTMVKELQEHGFVGDIIPWTRGVDREIFSPDITKKTNRENPLLVCVSRVSKEKGIDDFCKLPYPNAKKVVVGSGPYLDDLRKKYPDVEFVGAKRGQDLAKYYQKADCFVFPSKSDTFGIVIIESLACGTPVACYPVSGPIDIIENGVSGYMYDDLHSAVESCLRLDRNRVFEASKTWSWENCWQIFKNSLVAKN